MRENGRYRPCPSFKLKKDLPYPMFMQMQDVSKIRFTWQNIFRHIE
jgi:hypothetical protein